MAKKSTKGAAASASSASQATIHAATLEPRADGGGVIRGRELTEAEAVVERRAGRDVVVCGPSKRSNRAIAQRIENAANGRWKRCPRHANAGPDALPHYQPDPRPPEGHCFYEVDDTKAKP